MSFLDMRWPGPRSPDELKDFYSSALRTQNLEDTKLARTEPSPSSHSTYSSSGSSRAESRSCTSIFSGHARNTSTATSVSDRKTEVALASRSTYEDSTDLLPLHEWQRSSAQDIELHAIQANLGSEGADSSVLHQSEKIQEEPLRYKSRTKGPLSLSRILASDASNQDGVPDRDTPLSTEPDPEDKFWLDTLQEHPYFSLEGQQKLGRVGMWAVKRRHRDLKTSNSNKKETTAVDIEDDLVQNVLLEDSSLESDDETIQPIEDAVGDVASLMGSSESRERHWCFRTGRSHSSRRTLLLDFGKDSGLRPSLDAEHFDSQSVLSLASTTSTFILCDCADSDDMAENDLPKQSKRKIGKLQKAESVSHWCVFCFEHFESWDQWEEHEYSTHVATQRDWICMPWGAIEKLDNGHKICAFCDHLNPSSSHCSRHNAEACCDTSVTGRTYSCQADFEKHLREVHDQYTVTDRMLAKWSFNAENEDWYWQCGFCERSLVRWEDRSKHIGRHFKEGITMASWDPFVPPTPIDRSTGVVVKWSPPVDMDRRKALYDHLQSRQLDDSVSRDLVKPEECHTCMLRLDNEACTGRHERLWHLPRDVWLCPTKDDARKATYLQTGPLASFLFPSALPSPHSTNDVCPYCGDYSEDIFYDFDEDIYDCPADWRIRIKHLELAHRFDKCSTKYLFFRSDQFLLHLVGSHNLRLGKWTKDVMDSCRRRNFVLPKLSFDVEKIGSM